jgi:hypothetical protein
LYLAHLGSTGRTNRPVSIAAATVSLSVAFVFFTAPVFGGTSDDATVRGISGSNVLRGISGSNVVRGISGSNVLRGISGSNVLRGSGDVPNLAEYSSVAIGPVESISVDGPNTKVSILGQTFATTPGVASNVAVGDYVVAVGNNGALAGIYPTGQSYVVGVSPVALRGVVSSVDATRATMSVGSTSIDYSSILASRPEFQPQVDEVVEVDGMQPALGGSLLAGLSDRALVSGYQVIH